MQDLTEAYFSIYENHDDLSEVKGYGGHVDPQTGKSSGLRSPSQQAHAKHWDNKRRGKDVPDPRKSKFRSGGSKGSTTGYHQGEPPEDFAKKQDPGLAMTPAKRMETRANALEKRGQGKRANKIRSVLNRPNMQEDYVDEGRAFPGGPDLAHTVPLSPEDRATLERIKRERKAQAAERANTSQTRSARKPEQQGDRKRTTNLKDVRIGESHDFYDLVLDYLLDEGYADTEENAISMMSAMSEDWIDSIISEAPFQISGPHPTEYDGVKLDYKPSNVGKPYKNKKRAETKADKLNQDHGANVYRVTKVD